jgi:hypothetical protein
MHLVGLSRVYIYHDTRLRECKELSASRYDHFYPLRNSFLFLTSLARIQQDVSSAEILELCGAIIPQESGS